MRPFSARTAYDAPIADVAAMMSDREFVEHKVAASKPTTSRVDVKVAADGAFTIDTTRALPTDHLPAAAQRLVGRTIEIALIERWGPADDDGSRQGTIDLRVVGKPASASGTATMTTAGAGTVLVYEGTVEAKVPLIGGKLEEQAVQQVQSVLELERSVGAAWLASH